MDNSKSDSSAIYPNAMPMTNKLKGSETSFLFRDLGMINIHVL